MAYVAVISLKHTLEHLMDPCNDLLAPPSKQIIKSAYKEVNSVHKHLKELDCMSWKRSVNALEEGLREELFNFEDVIESHISNQLLSQSQKKGQPLPFSADLEDLKPRIRSLTEELKKMKWAYLGDYATWMTRTTTTMMCLQD